METLLEATTVAEVVLPYLDNVDRLLAVAYGAATGGLTGTYLAMLNDPVVWFQERGADRVTFINTDDDDGGELRGLEFPDDGGGLDGALRPKWFKPPFSGQENGPRGAPASLLPMGSALLLPPVDWLLLPYAHKPSREKLKAFGQALNAAFGSACRREDFFASVVADRAKRATLRLCYDEIWRDHNLVSMALYAGPCRVDHGWEGCGHHRWGRDYADEAGWLSTGDMHLDVAVRRKRFLDFYSQLLDRVNVFGLPHHGSRHNFDQTLLPPMSNFTQAIAAAGPNSYGHPSKWVRDSVESIGREFVKVNDRGNRVLTWKHKR